MASNIETVDGVLVLTKDNFEEATKGKTILVHFDAPQSCRCHNYAHKLAQAAKKLAEDQSPWLIGKVDCTVEAELAATFRIGGFSAFCFFNGETGLNVAARDDLSSCDKILQWMAKKSGPAAVELTSAMEAYIFKGREDVVVVGYFTSKESQMAKAFLEVAWQIDGFSFGIAYEKEIAEELEFTDEGVVLFKQFDERRVVFEEELTFPNLRSFIVNHSAPFVQQFPSSDRLNYCEKTKFCVIFMERGSAEYENILAAARIVAKEFRDKILVMSIDPIAFDEDEDEEGVSFAFSLTKIKVDKEVFPALRYIELKEDGIGKYKPEKVDLTEDGLRSFLKGVLAGEIKEYYASVPLPEDWNEKPVKVLVQSNFDQVAFDNSKDVFVDFYATWCGPCRKVAPIIEQLAEKFTGNEGVLVAKIDADNNELEHTSINCFPTFKLYKRETNEVIEYNGPWDLENFSKFLESGGEFVPPEETVGEFIYNIETDEESAEETSESDEENEAINEKIGSCPGTQRGIQEEPEKQAEEFKI